MKYESNILERLIKTYGVVGNPKYLSEIIKQFITHGKECYPNLFTYQSDWLSHIDEFGLENDYVVTYTGQRFYAPNTKGSPVKRAILSGSTKYRDIDTGDILDTFDETKNLELVSVKMPVLTTSNEDGTKTNILTVNEEVTLRGIGNVQDELNLMTGEKVERVGEVFSNSLQTSGALSIGTYANVIPVNYPVNFLGWDNANLICDKLKTIKRADINWDKTSSINGISLCRNGFWVVVDKTITTQEQANEYLNNLNATIQYELPTTVIKTVDLNIKDQNNQVVNHLTSFEGGTHFDTSSQTGSVLPTLEVDVVVDLEETLMMCSTEGNTM